MHQLSFILPVRIDNEDRVINLKASLKFIISNFPQSEIIVIEDDSVSKCQEWDEISQVNYIFRKNKRSFAKSRVLNHGLLTAKNEIVVIYDIDVLINPSVLKKAAQKILKSKYSIFLPHNEVWVNVKNGLKESILKNPLVNNVPYFKRIVKRDYSEDIDLYSISSGVVLFNKELLIKIGGFNENMISYGWEDIEVLKRASKLGIYYFGLKGGNIIHLDHKRGIDSKQNNFYIRNKEEFLKTTQMPAQNLLRYINEELSISKDHSLSHKEYMEIQRSNLCTLAYFRFFLNRINAKLTNGKFLSKITESLKLESA